MTIRSALRWIGRPTSTRQVARSIVRRADTLRDAHAYREAAILYEEALRFAPGHRGIHVQCGHMLKESGDFAAAEEHYRIADAIKPGDADLAMQFGHLYKLSGRPSEAEAAYCRAIELKPGWAEAKAELANLRKDQKRRYESMPGAADDLDQYLDIAVRQLGEAAVRPALLPDLMPRPEHERLTSHGEDFEIRRVGRPERTHWGVLPVLRGVEALRGFCISALPMTEIQVLLNGRELYRGAIDAGFPLAHERHRHELRKYPFNVWIDFTNIPAGRYELEFRIFNARGRTRERHVQVVVETALAEADYPGSDGILNLDGNDTRAIETQINERPSMVRPGRRYLFARPPKAILVQRVDQLGDMVVSVPAVRRLREMFPDARFVGLVSNANVDLARSLNLFDETIAIDFPEDNISRRRILSLERQRELADTLARYKFDIAIDLSENTWSRQLLMLSGAPFLHGFGAPDMPALRMTVEGATRDRWTNMEVMPHTNKQLAMVEWLAAMMRSESNVVPRAASSAEALAAHGISVGDRYAVLHDGARLRFSRWAGYLDLAARLIKRDGLKVVMLTDSPDTRDLLPTGLLGSDKFRLIDQRLSFDEFDALLANCLIFIGNDSGPKHLASLRGAKVVSIHMSRNGWNEWGQENGGLIISRKVPCAGCVIHHDPEECAKDFACMRNITVDEVYGAVQTLLEGDGKTELDFVAATQASSRVGN